MSAFVSKSRRIRFQLELRIIDLNNVPLVSGQSYVKWHLPSSTAAEHRGRTPKCAIKDHRVVYDYEKGISVRLTVGKDGMLAECSVDFEVVQEYSAGGKPERIRLGQVRLNLAEYVEPSEGTPASPGNGRGTNGGDEGQGVVRRYLMQDSKINSTLKLGISMRHLEGTRDYTAPPLRTAPVFGGIAGVISHADPPQTTDGDNQPSAVVDMPSLSSTNRENGEMQDMYRRTLAAYWHSQPGELKADECIEDIFAGGDGWGKAGRPKDLKGEDEASQPGSGASTPNPDADTNGHHHRRKHGGSGSKTTMGLNGRGAGGGRVTYASRMGGGPRKGTKEIDEFDVREDLRSWTIGEQAYT